MPFTELAICVHRHHTRFDPVCKGHNNVYLAIPMVALSGSQITALRFGVTRTRIRGSHGLLPRLDFACRTEFALGVDRLETSRAEPSLQTPHSRVEGDRRDPGSSLPSAGRPLQLDTICKGDRRRRMVYIALGDGYLKPMA
jgi:hypothetical protein